MAREMKDSGIEWIGEIPKEWLVKKMKHGFTIFAGATPKSEKSEYWNGEISWITPADYKTEDKYVYTGRKNISMEGYKSCGTTIVPKGSIIFSKRAPVGTVAISGNELCTNQGCLACVPLNMIDSIYYYYVISVFTEQFELVSSGTTFKEISANAFANFQLPFPIYEEQIKISSFLDKKCAELDNVLEKTRASIEEYKKLMQAVITQAVTKGIRGDRKMRDSGIEWIGEIPEDWYVKRLRYLGRCQNGISKSSEYFGEGYPFVSYGDVYRNYQLPEMVTGLIMSTDSDRENYSVIRGDVFFTRTSETIEEVGFSSVCLKTIKYATFAGFVIRFRPHGNELLPEYSKYYFRSNIHRRFFVKEMNLVTRASLGQELLKKLPVILPSLEEQEEIVNYLDQKCSAIDELIAKKEQYLSEIENYKKSLIYDYVTGKKEVPQIVSGIK